MKKNDDITLSITAQTITGAGIARHDGLAVFVDGTAVGDTINVHIIKVKSNYAIGKLTEVINPSIDRISVDCSCFARCGGCAFRHIGYEAELRAKEQSVADAMKRIGGIDLPPCPIIPAPKTNGYRNKAQYPVCLGENGISYGFYARHSHRVIESSSCALQPPEFDAIMQVIVNWANENNISAYNEVTGKGLLRHVLLRKGETSGEIMVVPVINGQTLPYAQKLKDALKELLGSSLACFGYNCNTADTNVILGEKTILVYGSATIKDTICGVEVEIAPESFYQVNREAAEVLYSKAATYIEENDRVILDLFCGIGSIGLSLLSVCGEKERSLYGVEIVPQAVENAKQNAAKMGYKNCTFFADDATGAAKKLNSKGIRPDVVVVDPPRKGCDAELLNTIANGFAPNKLIYISCDPATLARDSAILKTLGYELKEYTPVDLFPRTAHVETVALFVQTVSAI